MELCCQVIAKIQQAQHYSLDLHLLLCNDSRTRLVMWPSPSILVILLRPSHSSTSAPCASSPSNCRMRLLPNSNRVRAVRSARVLFGKGGGGDLVVLECVQSVLWGVGTGRDAGAGS